MILLYFQTKCECALIHPTRKKQIQYSFKLIKTVKCKLRIWGKPAIIINNLLHLYIAFLGTQSALHMGGGLLFLQPEVYILHFLVWKAFYISYK